MYLQRLNRETSCETEGEMVEIRVKFSDDDKHVHIFVGDEVVPVVTMHKDGVNTWLVEERTPDGEQVVAKGYGNYHDMLGIAVGTAAGRRWNP